jgi:hypothetical protein
MLRWLLLGVFAALAQAQEDEEGRSVLLLYKKMEPLESITVGQPINVTLSVFNKGLGNAYSLVVNDDNWKSDKFRIVAGGNNFTLDYLNAGDQYVHEFTVVPIKKTWHRVRPAKMAFIDGVEGENTIMHMSNTLPDFRITVATNALEENLLMVGRVVTLNTVQTKKGWMTIGGLLVVVLLIQLVSVAKAVLQKRRHLRALDELKKDSKM